MIEAIGRLRQKRIGGCSLRSQPWSVVVVVVVIHIAIVGRRLGKVVGEVQVAREVLHVSEKGKGETKNTLTNI